MKIKETAIKIYAKPWGKGALFGFIFGALIAIISAFEMFAETFMEPVPQILSSLPVYIAMKYPFDAPWFFIIILFFIYWIALGVFIGWSVTRSKVVRILTVMFIIVLLFAHIKADHAIQGDIEAAVDSFMELMGVFSGN